MDIKTRINERNELCKALRTIIVDRLMLEIPADFISNDQPLVGRGLELDSIDSLEISVAVNMEMDITITDNSSDIFSSVNSIADFVESKRNEKFDKVAV